MLVAWLLVGMVPTLLVLRRGVQRELGQKYVPWPGFVEDLRREAVGYAVYCVGLLFWPVVLVKRRAVVQWLLPRPWLVLASRRMTDDS
jgi:hypothetical protein